MRRPQAGAARTAVQAARASPGLPSRCARPPGPRGAQRLRSRKRLRAAGGVGGRRLGERPALAARGHRGNYTPRCRRLPAPPRIRLPAPLPPPRNCSLHLSEGAGKRGRGQLPPGTTLGSALSARLPRSPGRAHRPLQRVPERYSLGSDFRSREKAAGLLSTRFRTGAAGPCPAILPPASATTPSVPRPGAPIFQVSPASPCRAFLVPARPLDLLPEASEAFSVPGRPRYK